MSVRYCECELRRKALIAPELEPACALRVALHARADVVVARPAEALAARAVQRGARVAERREVFSPPELKQLECLLGLPRGGPVGKRLGRADSGRAQGRETVRLRGKGVRNPKTKAYGDHLYTVQIVVPEVLSPAGEDGARAVADLYRGDPREKLPLAL